MKTLVNFFMVVLLVGCGAAPEENQQMDKSSSSSSSDEESSYTSYYSETEIERLGETTVVDYEEYFRMEGYVSPINIYVFDEQYSDSEDFFTKETARLQKQMEEDYPDYTLSFEATIGLKDFKRDLQAYLTPFEERGIASETPVDGSGNFTFTLPTWITEEDQENMYTLRVSKRIGMRLTNNDDGDDVIYWCYNFFAEKDIVVEQNNPVVLRHFETSLTAYKCSDDNNNDYISLPERR
jgi:hypothetical protein